MTGLFQTSARVGVALGLLLLAGCQVRSAGTFETRLMEGSMRRITIGGKSDVNPLPATRENISAGQRNFTSYCMVCHGLDGQNTGVPFADKMAPPVPPLSSAAVQAYTDGPTASDYLRRNFSFRHACLQHNLS